MDDGGHCLALNHGALHNLGVYTTIFGSLGTNLRYNYSKLDFMDINNPNVYPANIVQVQEKMDGASTSFDSLPLSNH